MTHICRWYWLDDGAYEAILQGKDWDTFALCGISHDHVSVVPECEIEEATCDACILLYFSAQADKAQE